ncbi:MAG: helix-turn-helix transcriptional regulator [Lachnospiraceae bacterium]|nr:helix-turn-helix transcriptional regulator [Lachnospiraceae bacterium]
MDRIKKLVNIEIGARLRESRINLGLSQAQMSEILEVTDEHYRKLESGSSGLTIAKLRLLYEKLGIEPTYLLTGEKPAAFDLEKYIANCTLEQSNALFARSLKYFWNMVQEKKMEEE